MATPVGVPRGGCSDQGLFSKFHIVVCVVFVVSRNAGSIKKGVAFKNSSHVSRGFEREKKKQPASQTTPFQHSDPGIMYDVVQPDSDEEHMASHNHYITASFQTNLGCEALQCITRKSITGSGNIGTSIFSRISKPTVKTRWVSDWGPSAVVGVTSGRGRGEQTLT